MQGMLATSWSLPASQGQSPFDSARASDDAGCPSNPKERHMAYAHLRYHLRATWGLIRTHHRRIPRLWEAKAEAQHTEICGLKLMRGLLGSCHVLGQIGFSQDLLGASFKVWWQMLGPWLVVCPKISCMQRRVLHETSHFQRV